jgi:hypothetical protein
VEGIKNIIKYKKPKFWGVIITITIVIILGIALVTNPKDNELDLSYLK